ncbi:MAG: hypothetical protein HY851_10855 [candidate division Zixibacteria bacterium]|nr:hypothetical protein [candidate division Zixibacteria bacterium]
MPAVKQRKRPAQSIGADITRLDQLKTSFDRAAARTKATLLKRLATADISRAADLEKYHDLLCFLRTYPDSPAQLSRVEKELFQFASRIEKYKKQSRDYETAELADSGIVNTSVSHTFSYDLTRALAVWYPDLFDISWDEYNESESANIISFLPLLVGWQENDSIDNDPDFDIQSWLTKTAAGRRTSLGMLLHLLASSRLDHPTARALFENAEIPLCWKLINCSGSRTFKRLPARTIFYQTSPLVGRTSDLRRDLARPARPLVHLQRSEGEVYVRAIKEVLGVRCRELFPLIGSNPAEVYRYRPGRGVEIIIFGNNPDIRLPLESNFGAMLLRNGMPVGYGISAMLFDRAEIAINIFPAYRTGESSFIIEHFFHLFVRHFGARVLLVRSYQVGDDNEEAIESGSFWFYYKLGFRPVKKRVRDLAAVEARRVFSKKGYRTPESMLKRLSRSDVYLHLNPSQTEGYDELSLPNLGYAVSYYIRDRFDGNRQLAEDGSVKRLVKLLPIRDFNRWSANEQTGLRRLAPLVCCIRDLARWSAADRRLLAQLIRAKGSTRERDFAALMLQHDRFQRAVWNLANTTTPPATS